MKIFLDQYKSLQKIIDENNEVMAEKLDLQTLVNNLVKTALEDPNFDWDATNKLNYNFWGVVADNEVKNLRLSLDLYKQLDKKVGGFPQDKNARIDKINNTIAGILLGTANYKWKIRREILKNLDEDNEKTLSWKKQIIDQNWTADLIIAFLDKYDWLYNLKYSDNFVSIDCPSCEHADFGIWINDADDNGSKYVGIKCDRASCLFSQGGDIWGLIEGTVGTDKDTTIADIYNLFINLDKEKIDKIKDAAGYRVRNKKEKAKNIDFDKIFENLKKDTIENTNAYNYMYRLGFQKEDLLDGDVYFRGEEKYYDSSDKLRNRICYVIKDLEEKIVGIQARSIWETKEERWSNFIKNEKEYSNPKYKEIYDQMLEKKVLNTAGIWTSTNLYLLYRYINDAKNNRFRRLVIAEGPKDALRVYSQRLVNTAVVSSFSNKLTSEQIALIKKVFNKDKLEIELAYDGDLAGFEGNLKAYVKLKQAGFKKIVFVIYPAKNKKSYFKDFGEMNCRQGTFKKVSETVYCPVSLNLYMETMHARDISSPKIEEKIKRFENGEEIEFEENKKEVKEKTIAEKVEEKCLNIMLNSLRRKEEKEKEQKEKEEKFSNTEYGETIEASEKENNAEVEAETKAEEVISNEELNRLLSQPPTKKFNLEPEKITKEWLEELKELSQKELEKENKKIDIDVEVDKLGENGYINWIIQFRKEIGDLEYTTTLIPAILKYRNKTENIDDCCKDNKSAIIPPPADFNYADMYVNIKYATDEESPF